MVLTNYYKESKDNPSGIIPVYLIPNIVVYNTTRFIQTQIDWLGFGLSLTFKKKKMDVPSKDEIV